MQTLRGHSGPVYDTCFTADGTVLLSASEDTSGKFINHPRGGSLNEDAFKELFKGNCMC